MKFQQRDSARSTSAHPTDSSIALTLHQVNTCKTKEPIVLN